MLDPPVHATRQRTAGHPHLKVGDIDGGRVQVGDDTALGHADRL
jgi:hypothetical protein